LDIRDRVIDLIEKWYKVLGDPRLEVKVMFSEVSRDESRSGTTVDEEYLTVLFSFNEGRLRDELDELELEQEIIHEILHTQVWRVARRLEELGCDQGEVARLEESLVTSLERSIWELVSTLKDNTKT